MAKLVGYKCEKCGQEDEEIFNDTEEKPEALDRPCPKCGGKLVLHDMKKNCQRYKFHDMGGM